MNAKQVHYELIMATEKVIKSYRDDLFIHDFNALEADDTRNRQVSPFFHVAYESGTILDIMYPIHDYPYGDKTIPYLFGTCNKFQLLEQVGYSLRSGQSCHDFALVHYFDGETLRKIDIEEGQAILVEYKAKMHKALIDREVNFE
jgi:hypothetical protein